MALKTNVGSVFDKVLSEAAGKKGANKQRSIPEEKPFWHVDEEKGEGDEKPSARDDDDEDEKDDSPKSFAEHVKRSRESGRLSGEMSEDDEEEPPVKKKKKKKVKPVEDDSYEEEVDIRIPKKKKEDEDKKETTEEESPEDEEGDGKGKKAGQESETEAEDGSPKLTEEEQKRLDDAIGINPSTLVNKDGRPMGEHGSKLFKKLQKTVQYFADKARKAEKRANVDPVLLEDHKQLRANYDTLKKKWDTKYFEETPEWKLKFEDPLEQASTEAAKWIRSHDHADDSEEIMALEKHRHEMQKALKAKDDVKYYEHSDAIAEFLKKGAGGRFQQAVPKLWDAYWNRENAYKDKDAAAKSVTEDANAFIAENVKKATASLDVMLEQFEKDNEKIITIYKTKPGIRDHMDYENTVTKRLQTTKQLVDQTLRTRAIPAKLQEIIYSGVVAALKEKEMDGLRLHLKQVKEDNERLVAQLEKKKATLDRVKPSPKVARDDDDDDEEGDDDAEDFTTHFKRRMKQSA